MKIPKSITKRDIQWYLQVLGYWSIYYNGTKVHTRKQMILFLQIFLKIPKYTSKLKHAIGCEKIAKIL